MKKSNGHINNSSYFTYKDFKEAVEYYQYLEKSRIKSVDDVIDFGHILPYLKSIYNNCSDDTRLLITI